MSEAENSTICGCGRSLAEECEPDIGLCWRCTESRRMMDLRDHETMMCVMR